MLQAPLPTDDDADKESMETKVENLKTQISERQKALDTTADLWSLNSK